MATNQRKFQAAYSKYKAQGLSDDIAFSRADADSQSVLTSEAPGAGEPKKLGLGEKIKMAIMGKHYKSAKTKDLETKTRERLGKAFR
jgi:hypothetical protein